MDAMESRKNVKVMKIELRKLICFCFFPVFFFLIFDTYYLSV